MNEKIENIINEIREKQTIEVIENILKFMEERKDQDPKDTLEIIGYLLKGKLKSSTVDPFEYEDKD